MQNEKPRMTMLSMDASLPDRRTRLSPLHHDERAALLRRAATLLGQARECRNLAAGVGKKASRAAHALALELEARAQVLIVRAEHRD
jgi:hypothetical protein